jgi:hypothetical protein
MRLTNCAIILAGKSSKRFYDTEINLKETKSIHFDSKENPTHTKIFNRLFIVLNMVVH